MERISSKHGPRLDDALAEEAAPLVHGAAHEPRAQEHRESEETTGLPPGGAVARREIARHLDSRTFPADRDAIVGNATENGAPDSVLGLLSALPGGGETAQTQPAAPPTTAAPPTEATTTAPATAAAEGDPEAGKQVFSSAGCGGCHTLEAAGATGTVGPNLDELKPGFEAVVAQVTNGGGAMPAFKDKLSEQQIAAVAAFVVQSTSG
jgi:mono/diheme cytochrome c family protein